MLGTLEDVIALHTRLESKGPVLAASEVWAYRGQSRPYGNLLPSLSRQLINNSPQSARMIERRLVDSFRAIYSELHSSGISPAMPQPSEIGDGRDLRCLSVMQHYGVPTRLLDWTTSFWTAVYFACSGSPGEQAKLWYYRRDLFAEQRERMPWLKDLIEPSVRSKAEPNVLEAPGALIAELDWGLTPRMHGQFGLHTVSSDILADHETLIKALDLSTASLANPKQRCASIGISPKCKAHVLKFMQATLGLHAARVYPDMDGLGQLLRFQLESDKIMFFT